MKSATKRRLMVIRGRKACTGWCRVRACAEAAVLCNCRILAVMILEGSQVRLLRLSSQLRSPHLESASSRFGAVVSHAGEGVALPDWKVGRGSLVMTR